MFNRTGRTIAKVQCPYCPLTVYPGNVTRHERACLDRIDRRRRREAVQQLREGAAA